MYRVDGQQWSMHEELLAVTAERVDLWGWVQAHLRADKKAKKALPKKPLEIPRPGIRTSTGGAADSQRSEQRRQVNDDPDKADAFFAQTPKF